MTIVPDPVRNRRRRPEPRPLGYIRTVFREPGGIALGTVAQYSVRAPET